MSVVVDAEDGPLSNILVDGAWVTQPCSKQTSRGQPCVGESFMHDANQGKGLKSVTFSQIAVVHPNRYHVALVYSASSSRAMNVPITITHDDGTTEVVVNQQRSVAASADGAVFLGTFNLTPGSASVRVGTGGTSGKVIVDALILNCASGDVLPPTVSPTAAPTASPTSGPTENFSPTASPTVNVSPTSSPTLVPTTLPTEPCVDVVVDAEDGTDVTVVGLWALRECSLAPSTGACQNRFFMHDGNAHKGTKYVRFGTSALHTRARYLVRMAYSVSRSRADAVPVTIVTASGEEATVLVNQRTFAPESDGYLPLGVFDLMPSVSSVTISNIDTEGKVVVDAIKFVCAMGSGGPATRAPTPVPSAPPTAAPTDTPTEPVCQNVLVDPTSTDGAQAVFTGVWVERDCAANAPNPAHCVGSKFYHDANIRKGESSVTVHTHGLTSAGMYEIFQAHTVSGSRAQAVPVTINHAGGSTVVMVDQQQAGTAGFVSLGAFALAPGVSTVVVANNGTSGKVIFDAIAFRCVLG